MEHKFVCEKIGFAFTTIIRDDNRTVISRGLQIDELVNFWKRELNIPKEDNIVLLVSKDLYRKIHYAPYSCALSTLKILNNYGVSVEIIKE